MPAGPGVRPAFSCSHLGVPDILCKFLWIMPLPLAAWLFSPPSQRKQAQGRIVSQQATEDKLTESVPSIRGLSCIV